MAVLVTGGAGFIGNRLARALRARGERVIILDNFDNLYDPAIKRENIAPMLSDPDTVIVEGDVRNAPLVESVVKEHGVTRIAHMAGIANVRRSIEQAPLYFEVNLLGSVNLLEAARKHGVTQFVQASTSSVYGETSRLPFSEDDSADLPLAPYPASKRAAELAGHSHHHLFGLNVTCLRFFNVYGPNGRPDMMPLRVMNALVNNDPIPLFNGGNFSRDWTYIDDITAGILAALDTPLGYAVINLGCGAPISMNEFVDILEEMSGREAHRVNAAAPPSDPPITFCDNSRARQLLGFAPAVSIHEGLARTWQWFADKHQIRRR